MEVSERGSVRRVRWTEPFRFYDLLVNRMELQRSLFLRRKAEIEIISSSTIGMQAGVHPLIAYLSEKMTNVVQSLSSCAFRLSGAPY